MAQTVIEIIKQYDGLDYVCGKNDCNLMVLELTGFDTSTIEPFNSIKSGRTNIRAAIDCMTLDEYLIKNNYKEIEYQFLTDGCVVLCGIHAGIWFNGLLFGVSNRKKFEFQKIDLDQLSKLQIFKRN
ncbi:hypothetical protein [Photobacterium damselae]|uniref:hypothetical protein n=1 Tax=Photobacterium damselae TaxID=38293 RepID=UPI00165E9A77|nr:hypothetical protein [Photobacterium damselae]